MTAPDTAETGELRFDGRVAIVTGAGAGCGREYALLLAKRGAKVMINDISAERANDTHEDIKRDGGESRTFVASIADKDSGSKLVSETIDSFGRIDILINNAGNFMTKPFEEYSFDDFRLCMSSHFEGAWHMTQAAWPHLQKQQYGRIVNVSSAAVMGVDQMAAYGAAKGAMLGWSKALAIEGARHGILVNALAPGAYTPMLQGTIKDMELQAQLKKLMPAWAVAPVVAWLVHESCTRSGDFAFAVGPGFGSIFLGETLGVASEHDIYTPEFIRRHYAEAFEQQGYNTPESMMDDSVYANARVKGELVPFKKA